MADAPVPPAKPTRKPLTVERARELLRYDPETGLLYRRTDSGTRWYAGDVAGCFSKHLGYILIRIDDVLYRAHRVIWLIQTGQWPAGQIDHINRNRAFNAWSNLREATPKSNRWNQKRRCDSKSGLKGAWLSRGRWTAQITINGRATHLGNFESAEKAHAAYVASAKLHFGKFAHGGHVSDAAASKPGLEIEKSTRQRETTS